MATTDTILTEREEKTIHTAAQGWSEAFAKKVVLQDFRAAEADRTSNHEARWADAERLYLAYEQAKVWPGTRISRANIPVFTVFTQVESLMPRFMDIFADYPWAEAEAMPGTKPETARQHRDLILYQFNRAGGNVNGKESGAHRHCRRAFKSALKLGNGILEAGWETFTRPRKKLVTSYRQSMRGFLPTPQGIVPIPGPNIRSVREVTDQEIINRPFIRYVSLRDFYIEVNCPSPFVQDARWAAKRNLVTLDYLKMLRGQEAGNGFTIPSDEELIGLLEKRHQTMGDQAKREAESFRGVDANPRQDTSADPGSKKLEVIEYKTAERIVWLLEREHVIYKEVNQYGQINFFDAFYTDVLDRFYGLSISDVVEGDQRISRSLIEARLDELSLGIHRTRIKKRGSNIPAYQLLRRPGAVIETNDPENDVKIEDVKDITAQAVFEQQAAELRSQRTTGVSELSVIGAAATQGNSAARTATGVNAQGSAVGKRHGYMVETNEAEFLEPLLDFMAEMNSTFLDPDEAIQFLGQKGEEQEIDDPTEIMNSRVRFKLHAGSRIRSRMGSMQALPIIFQSLLNPAFLAQLQKEGKTVDADEIAALIADATDRPRQSLFRALTEDEMQAASQPPPEEKIRADMQRERIQSADKNAEVRGIFDLLKTHIQEETKKQVAAAKKESDAERAA